MRSVPVSEHGFETEGLVERFGGTTALDGVGLAVPRGRVLGLLGPNGAGKTTVIRILATLLHPDASRAAVAGFDVVRHPGRVRRRIALSGRHTSVDEELAGLANLVMIGRLLDLAASLIGRPEVVFLDEPSAGLDPGRREELWQMIRGLAGDGVTVLLTTQYLEEADALADAITVVAHGRVIAAVAGRAPDLTTRRELVVPVAGEDDLYEITARFRERAIGVSELSLRLPSLDEVFLALTGAPTAASADTPDPTKAA